MVSTTPCSQYPRVQAASSIPCINPQPLKATRVGELASIADLAISSIFELSFLDEVLVAHLVGRPAVREDGVFWKVLVRTYVEEFVRLQGGRVDEAHDELDRR